jgi:hypothetical protein
MTKFKRFCLLSAATIGLLASAAVAQSQDGESEDFYSRNKYEAVLERAQPEFDPEPVRLGTFLVKSNAEIGVLSTSNVFASSTRDESDIIGRIGAEAQARTDWNVHQIGFDVSAYRNEYLDFSDESTTDLTARALGRLDVTRDFSLGANVFADDRAEPRTDFFDSVSIDRPVKYNRTGAGLDVNYQNDRVRWTNGVTYATYNYKDGRATGTGTNIDQDFRDLKRIDARSRLSYAISPDVALYGQTTYADSSYDNAELIGGQLRKRDSKGYTVAAGVDFELTALIRGDVAVGFLNEEKDDAFFKDIDGLSLDARVQWFPTQLTTVSFNAARRVVDIGVPQAPSALNTSFGARVDHELRRNIILSGFAGTSKYDYQEIDREDDVLDIGASATYKMNKRVHVEGFVRRFDRDGSGAAAFGGPTYDMNLVGVSLKLHP